MSKLLFLNNSYNILGLTTDATERSIIRRAKEIVNLLRIDEHPKYPNDIFFGRNIRTESSVEHAKQNLLDDKKQLKEFYFWFVLNDDDDDIAIKHLHDGNIAEGVSALAEKLEKHPNDFVALKNLAIAESIAFTVKKQKKYLTKSSEHWTQLLNSEIAWSHFKKLLGLLDNFNLDKSAVDVFQHRVAAQCLSDFYASMSKEMDDPSIYAAFSNKAKVRNGQVVASIVEPILSEILAIAEELANKEEDNDSSTTTELDADYYNHATDSIDQINNLSAKLMNLGDATWNSPKVITIRDHAALLLRRASVRIFNSIDIVKNEDDYELSVLLVETGAKVCGSTTTKNRFNRDIAEIKYLRSKEIINYSVSNLIKSEQFYEALDYINKNISKLNNTDQQQLRKIANNIRQLIGAHTIPDRSQPSQYNDAPTRSSGSVFFWIIVIIGFIIFLLLSNTSSNSDSSEALEACESSGYLNSSACQKAENEYGMDCKYKDARYPNEGIYCVEND